jgi:hypothetical protein
MECFAHIGDARSVSDKEIAQFDPTKRNRLKESFDLRETSKPGNEESRA